MSHTPRPIRPLYPSLARSGALARIRASLPGLLLAVLGVSLGGCEMRPGPGGRELRSGPAATPAEAPAPTPAPSPSPAAEGTPPAKAAPPRPPLPICDDALAPLSALRQGSGAPGSPRADAAPIVALVREADASLGRSDADAVLAALAEVRGDEARALAIGLVDRAIVRWLRDALRRAAEVPAERRPAWAAAECLFGLVAPAIREALAGEELGDGIALAFARGREALAGPVDAQERVILPARQAIEKRLYTAIARSLVAEAGAAAKGDPLALIRARVHFDHLQDRLKDKNTPGIAIIDAMLAGDEAAIDPQEIARQLDLAFVKRARKYASEVVTAEGLRGTPAGLASVSEGMTYSRLLLPGMRARLADKGFDADAYMATWEALLQASEAGDDPEELQRLSGELVHWNCAYQEALGIAECTSTHDEVAEVAAAKKKK